jgi:hypothetical protein
MSANTSGIRDVRLNSPGVPMTERARPRGQPWLRRHRAPPLNRNGRCDRAITAIEKAVVARSEPGFPDTILACSHVRSEDSRRGLPGFASPVVSRRSSPW